MALVDYPSIYFLIVYLVIYLIHLYRSLYSLPSNLYNLQASIIRSALAKRSIRTIGSFRYSRNRKIGIIVGITINPLVGLVGGEKLYAILLPQKISLQSIYSQYLFSQINLPDTRTSYFLPIAIANSLLYLQALRTLYQITIKLVIKKVRGNPQNAYQKNGQYINLQAL